MRERLRREYLRRVKVVFRTELYGRNKILAINGFALPVLTYGFGVIHWGGARTCSSSIDGLESSSLCTVSNILLQTLTDSTLLAVIGGRGLQQIESTYQSCIVRLSCYLADSSDLFMQMIPECDSGKSSHSIKRMACRFTAQLRRSLASDD